MASGGTRGERRDNEWHPDIERGRDPIYRVQQFIEVYTKSDAGIACKIRLNELLDAINVVPTLSTYNARPKTVGERTLDQVQSTPGTLKRKPSASVGKASSGLLPFTWGIKSCDDCLYTIDICTWSSPSPCIFSSKEAGA
jgi:hypothetical protein